MAVSFPSRSLSKVVNWATSVPRRAASDTSALVGPRISGGLSFLSSTLTNNLVVAENLPSNTLTSSRKPSRCAGSS